MSALIGIDIGTTSVKAVLADETGRHLDRYAARHEMFRPGPGAAEQAPEGWMAHVAAALDRFAGHPSADEVKAAGITSQVNTHVFVGEDGRALAPALTWQDTRAAEDAAPLDARLSDAVKIAALGAPIPIDASHALARMAWTAHTAPDIWAATRAVMAPKDYVIARLTGARVADPLASVGLVGTDLAYAPEILSLIPEAEALLPPLSDPLEIAGEIREGPFRGTQVATGTMDAWASMFGLGVAREGQAIYLSGTSEVLGLISGKRAGTPGVVTFPDWRGITLHAAPTQSGGASLDWAARMLGRDVAALGGIAAPIEIGPASPMFLPHLEGERAPLWDPLSRGALAGLSSTTGPAELAAAVMEGVAFSARLALEALEESGARKVDTLALGGGGAASDTWNRLRADALGRRLSRVAAADPGAMGALVMAGVACGLLPSLEQAADALISTAEAFRPDPARAALANTRFAEFQGLYGALRPLHHRMSPAPGGAIAGAAFV